MVYEEVGGGPTQRWLETAAKGVWHFLPAGDDALLLFFFLGKKERWLLNTIDRSLTGDFIDVVF